MIAKRPPLFVLPASMLLLSACATDHARYPSLARRDVERVVGTAQPANPAEPMTTTPARTPAGLDQRLAAIDADARAAHAEFLRRAAAAQSRARAAGDAAQGSLRWSDAIVAISDVESARSETMFSLAELDSMLATGAVAQADTGADQGLPQIAALREKVAALVAEQDAALVALTDPITG